MGNFDIPIVLIFFKRTEKTLLILKQVSKIRPQKIYLISDGPRNADEEILVVETRKKVEENIDWPCEIIKNYAEDNKGVYDRIGNGAKWVFSKESTAIFLEDDNFPEISFFDYCKELLEVYKSEDKVLWICGTNYLGNYATVSNESYMFTKHLLPCGWASWSNKFLKYYDGELNGFNNKTKKILRKKYESKSLYRQQMRSIMEEVSKRKENGKFSSWDFQMAFSIRINDLFGISPSVNLIENIGVDIHSIHGGTTMDKIMTSRFCGIKTRQLDFPLRHPSKVEVDYRYEKLIKNIILYPFGIRLKLAVKRPLSKILKFLFRMKPTDSFTIEIKKKISVLLTKKR